MSGGQLRQSSEPDVPNHKFAPSTLHFANLASSVGGGLEEQIRKFLREVQPDTSLIVIDTLQKVRKQGDDGADPYANDYRELPALKKLADEYHIAILLIHHPL